MCAEPGRCRRVAGYGTVPVEAVGALRGAARADIPRVAVAVAEHDVLGEHAEPPHGLFDVADVAGVVDLVDLLVEVAGGVHVGRAHHEGPAVLPRDHGREDIVVAGVLERARDRVTAPHLDGDVVRLHPAPLAVVLVAQRVGGIDFDLVAVGDVGRAGGHPPGHVAGVREDEHGPERVPRRVQIAGVHA